MVAFPNAKINLGLNIVRRRADGYHDLETGFHPLGWRDVLELSPTAEGEATDGVSLTLTGGVVEGPTEANICVKAWQVLRRECPGLPPVHMHLHKAIPTGAGLGGGSSDGVSALKLLRDMFHLSVSDERLEGLALELGSDCPFFVRNRPCFAEGRGERMRDIALDLSAYGIVVVHPGIHVSTAKAFAGVQPAVPTVRIPDILSRPVEAWRGVLVNDFEHSVFAAFPVIGAIKDRLYGAGALYASMSGSGSSVYGIFAGGALPEADLAFADGYRVFRQASLSPVSGK